MLAVLTSHTPIIHLSLFFHCDCMHPQQKGEKNTARQCLIFLTGQRTKAAIVFSFCQFLLPNLRRERGNPSYPDREKSNSLTAFAFPITSAWNPGIAPICRKERKKGRGWERKKKRETERKRDGAREAHVRLSHIERKCIIFQLIHPWGPLHTHQHTENIQKGYTKTSLISKFEKLLLKYEINCKIQDVNRVTFWECCF